MYAPVGFRGRWKKLVGPCQWPIEDCGARLRRNRISGNQRREVASDGTSILTGYIVVMHCIRDEVSLRSPSRGSGVI